MERHTVDAKERILNAAIELFSQKGYDAARVSDIADAANVNKALIYYYFKSKQDILDCMVESLLENALSLAMDFIHSSVARMVEEGQLEVQADRLHFTSEEARSIFQRETLSLYQRILDYVIEKRNVIRILMLESLKSGKHQNALFRFMKFLSGDYETLLAIPGTERRLSLSDEMTLFRFFFSVIPIVSFAAYFDDFKAVSPLSGEELRNSFLSVYQAVINSLIAGSDILLKGKSA